MGLGVIDISQNIKNENLWDIWEVKIESYEFHMQHHIYSFWLLQSLRFNFKMTPQTLADLIFFYFSISPVEPL